MYGDSKQGNEKLVKSIKSPLNWVNHKPMPAKGSYSISMYNDRYARRTLRPMATSRQHTFISEITLVHLTFTGNIYEETAISDVVSVKKIT